MTNKNITLNLEAPIVIYTGYLVVFLISISIISLSLYQFYTGFYIASDNLNKLTEKKSEISFDQINYKQFQAIANLSVKTEPLIINASTTSIIR